MANLKASKKDIRRIKRRNEQNGQQRARLRTFHKKVYKLVEEGKLEEAEKIARVYERFLDRAGRTHLVHPRNAARKKSRLALLLNKAKKAAA